jgi:hypothetical protein
VHSVASDSWDRLGKRTAGSLTYKLEYNRWHRHVIVVGVNGRDLCACYNR